MKKQKYPYLPRYICRQSSNGRFRNMKTGQWLSDSDLERYAVREAKTEQKQEFKQVKEHWTNRYYGN